MFKLLCRIIIIIIIKYEKKESKKKVRQGLNATGVGSKNAGSKPQTMQGFNQGFDLKKNLKSGKKQLPIRLRIQRQFFVRWNPNVTTFDFRLNQILKCFFEGAEKWLFQRFFQIRKFGFATVQPQHAHSRDKNHSIKIVFLYLFPIKRAASLTAGQHRIKISIDMRRFVFSVAIKQRQNSNFPMLCPLR